MKLPVLLVVVGMLAACENKKSPAVVRKKSATNTDASLVKKPATQIQTDTLQYIHFEGNFDYWYVVGINANKDTVQLVTDRQLPSKFRNKLLEVKWFTDTLTEAVDNEAPYAAKRLKSFRLIGGKLFSLPVTEQMVIKNIADLPEVRANADQVGIAEKPTDDKEYYLVETGTRDEDKFSRLFMFRVYVYPKYEIKYLNPADDTEMSLQEWRSKQQ
jgi:hypothetical protein